MRKARKIVSIIVTLCFLLTLVPAGAFAAPKDTETPFDDVQTTDWFYDTVQYVYDEGLMAGTGDRIFSPQQTTTRGMIVTILHRMAGSPEAETQDFTDVDPDAWYAPAINWSIESGVGAGYGGGLFGPDDAITREQMASFLYRYAELKDYDVTAVGDLNDFADASAVSDWAEDVMSWAVGADLFAGRDNNQLAPQGLTTRAEAATILMRYCENIVGTSAEEPSDEPSDDPSTEPDTPDVDDPSEDNPSVDPTPDDPDEPSTEPDNPSTEPEDPEEPDDDGEPGEISYTAPKAENIDTGKLEYNDQSFDAQYVDNQLIVVFKDDVSQQDIEDVTEEYGATIVGVIETLGMYQWQFSDGKTLEQLNALLAQLKELPSIKDAYLNTIVEIETQSSWYYPMDKWDIQESDDPDAAIWDELHPDGNNWGVEAINAPSAWQMLINKYGSIDAIPSIHAGIIDSYVDMTHPDLDVNTVYWYQNGFNIFKEDQTYNTVAENAAAVADDEPKKYENLVHGTHVMGILGATINNNTFNQNDEALRDGGINGVALNAELYAASIGDDVLNKTYNSFGSASALANLIENSGCKVINYSMGSTNTLLALFESQFVSDVLKGFLDKGKDFVIVTAACNEPENDAEFGSYFNCITDEKVKSRIIVVGNAEQSGSGFSLNEGQSGGDRVDVLAPGTNIYSTVSPNAKHSSNNHYRLLEGTSMAAPHVSGTAALVWAADPNLKGDQVKQIIVDSANIYVDGAIQQSMVNAAYAVAVALGEEYVVTGSCGENMSWALDVDGNLTIEGTGDMAWDTTLTPWYRYREDIKTITIGDGINSICDDAFLGCRFTTEVTLGKDIQSIGSQAFMGLLDLKKITIPENVTSIGEKAIGYKNTESKEDNFMIYGYSDSAAERYADQNDILFSDLESGGELNPPDESDDPDNPETGDSVFADGSGTEEDPYQVATAEQLNAVRDNPNAYYIQVKDISLEEYSHWNPIEDFYGGYNGNNKVISDLTITKMSNPGNAHYSAIGLFETARGAEIKNINLINVDIRVEAWTSTMLLDVGAIVGNFAGKVTIDNCHVRSGSIYYLVDTTLPKNTSVYIGGVAGKIYGVYNCSNNANITIDLPDALKDESTDSGRNVVCGGIAGSISGLGDGAKYCINNGEINADIFYYGIWCGGITGSSHDVPIDYCINNGDIYVESQELSKQEECSLGGITGIQVNNKLSNCINYGVINAEISEPSKNSSIYSGGIIGSADNISSCFNLTETMDINVSVDGTTETNMENIKRISGELDDSSLCTEAYSVDTLLNGQKATAECTTTERNGQTLSEEEMNEKIQYILEALGLDQTA